MSTKDDAIAHLLSLPEGDDMLLYWGEPVDATWPAKALLAMVHEITKDAARRQRLADLRPFAGHK